MFTIRTPEDANRVVRLARGRNAVVVGAGFLGEQLEVGRGVASPGAVPALGGAGCQPAAHHPGSGMEVAAYLTEKAHSVSVVELEETPFKRFLGERVGRALMKVSPQPLRTLDAQPSSSWARTHGLPALTDV